MQEPIRRTNRYPRCTCGTPGHGKDDPNEPKWNPECPVHTIGHYHKPGCCDVPQENMSPHRHMTKGEYETEFPEVYDKTFTVADSRYRLEARRFHDGIGATFTQLFGDDDDGGLCFDFSGEIVDPLIEHLQQLSKAVGPAERCPECDDPLSFHKIDPPGATTKRCVMADAGGGSCSCDFVQ